jgi:hypothetical protein
MKVPKEILPQLPKKKRLGILDPLFVEERRVSLEKYLQDLNTLRSCWSCPHFIQFLDDHPPVLFLQIQTAKLNDEVHYLRYQNEVLVSRYQENTTALTSANGMITDLYKRFIGMEEQMKRATYFRERSQESHLALDHHYHQQQQHQGPEVYPSQTHHYPSPHMIQRVSSQHQSNPSRQSFDQSSSETNRSYEILSHSSRSHPTVTSHHQPAPIAMPNESNRVVETLSWKDSSPYEPQSEPNIRRRKSLNSNTTVVSWTNVFELLSRLLPSSSSSYLDQFGDTILSMILPTYEQLQYRFQVEKFVAKLVRKSLGAQIHQMGIHSLKCFLPEDPISLSIYLCRGLEHSWYLRLNEKLCRMSTGVSSSPHPGSQPLVTPSVVSGLGAMSGIAKGLSDIPSPSDHQDLSSSSSSLFGHIISNVSFMDEHGVHSLQCLVANMTVDVRVNEKIDLCLYAFFEDFDRTIGRDHLLKKSLSLIRAWWTLEVPLHYTPTLLSSQYLPNESIIIMVCAIFNQYYQHISHPIHALCIFITEYASFDWTTHVLTIFGPIPRSSSSLSLQDNGGENKDSPSHEFCLQTFPNSVITLQLLERYRELANESSPPSSDGTENFSILDGRTTNSEGMMSSHSSSPFGRTPDTSIDQSTPKTRRSSLVALFERVEEDEEESELKTETHSLENHHSSLTDTTTSTSTRLEQRIVSSDCVKIFHPMDHHVNTVPDSMTEHFVSILTDIMKKGETHVLSILNCVLMIDASTSAGDHPSAVLYEKLDHMIQIFFTETISRYGQGWKPDLPTSAIVEIAAEAEASMEEFK